MEIALILIWILGGLWAWSCIYYYQTNKYYDPRYQTSKPNWGWSQTLGVTNPSGPIPTIAQILGWKKYPLDN